MHCIISGVTSIIFCNTYCTFAKVSTPKAAKWKRSAKHFEEKVVKEEILKKKKQIKTYEKELHIYLNIYRRRLQLCGACAFFMDEDNKEFYQRALTIHTHKISRLLTKATNVDEHIKNIIFFQKLVLSKGLNFAIPRPVSAKDLLKCVPNT